MTDLHDVDGPAPLDEAGLWATDALLDALAAGVPCDDDPAAVLLSALVGDIAPARTAARVPAPRRSRGRLAPRTGIASLAVIGVLSTGGVAAASVHAGPTSRLFPLHQVLTGGPQLDGSQRQALEVKRKLKSASRALAAGKVSSAARDVDAAQGRLPKVKPADGQHALAAQVTVLTRQVSAGAVPTIATAPVAKPTPTPARTSLTRTPTTTPIPVRPTRTPPPTTTAVPTTSPAAPTSSSPAAGGQPVGTVSPAPTSPSPTITTTPAPSSPASPSAPASATSGSPTPSGTPTAGKSHKPGKGKGGGKGPGKGPGGTPVPGSPPAPSFEPAPSTAPIMMPPVTMPPVTVPPASSPPAAGTP
jgi:hypothetical protein